MYQSATYAVLSELDPGQVPAGAIQKYWLPMITDGVGAPVRVPVLIARGKKRRAGGGADRCYPWQ
jgi:hypothetical protein